MYQPGPQTTRGKPRSEVHEQENKNKWLTMFQMEKEFGPEVALALRESSGPSHQGRLGLPARAGMCVHVADVCWVGRVPSGA